MPTSAMPPIECVELADVGIRAPFRFGSIVPMRVQCWRSKLSMNLVGDEVKSLTFHSAAKKISVSFPRLLPDCFWINGEP